MTTYHTIKTLNGYTAQARYFANHMLNDATGDTFVLLGWTCIEVVRADGYLVKHVKPVYQTLDGQRVVMLDGSNHRQVLICEIAADADIRHEDLDFYPQTAQESR